MWPGHSSSAERGTTVRLFVGFSSIWSVLRIWAYVRRGAGCNCTRALVGRECARRKACHWGGLGVCGDVHVLGGARPGALDPRRGSAFGALIDIGIAISPTYRRSGLDIPGPWIAGISAMYRRYTDDTAATCDIFYLPHATHGVCKGRRRRRGARGQLAQMLGGGRWGPKSSWAFAGPLRLARAFWAARGGPGLGPGSGGVLHAAGVNLRAETPAVSNSMVNVACQTGSPGFMNDDLV